MSRGKRLTVWDFINRLEGLMVRGIVLGVITLVISQALLTNEYGRNLLSQTDRLEGTTIQSFDSLEKKFDFPINYLGVNKSNLEKTGFISLRLLDNPKSGKVRVFLNEREAAQFNDELLTIRVHDKDLIQIDTAQCPNTVTLQIAAISDNLSLPRLNTKIISKGNIVSIGTVEFKK